jgi:hypothetical protein
LTDYVKAALLFIFINQLLNSNQLLSIKVDRSAMGKLKETEYKDIDDELLDEEEDFEDTELTEGVDDSLLDENDPGYKRTWRDAEKYKEIRELHKIINDDLYIGFDDDEFSDIDMDDR